MTATISNAGPGKYGHGLFPFGICQIAGCEQAACHEIPIKGQSTRVCMDHKPEGYSPVLGAQSNAYSRTERWVLAGGGAGGSKTYFSSRLWIKQWAIEHARWKRGEIRRSKGYCLFLRRTVPEFEQVRDDFVAYYKTVDPGATFNVKENIATFSCGYKVKFGGMENERDWKKYYGSAYTLLIFDEATQFTREQIDQLDTRVRCDDPVLGKMIQTIMCTNPVGYGLDTKAWMKRRFVRIADPWTPVKVKVKLRDGRVVEEWQIYCPFNLYDNPYYLRDGRYEASLLLRSPAMRRALLDNDWDVEDGSWADLDWDPAVHVCEPFPIPPGWFKFKCADYGFSSRSSINWIAVDPDGNKVVYRHLSTRGLTAEELGLKIKQIEMQPMYFKGQLITTPEWDNVNDRSMVRGVMDSSLWSKVGETGPSRGEILQKIGTGFWKSDKNPDSAAEQMRVHLRRRTRYPGKAPVPGIRIFTTCRASLQLPDGDVEETGPLITIPTCPVDPGNPDRWHDTSPLNHDLDALGYGLLSRPIEGREFTPLDPKEAFILDLIKVRNNKPQPRFPSWSNNGN